MRSKTTYGVGMKISIRPWTACWRRTSWTAERVQERRSYGLLDIDHDPFPDRFRPVPGDFSTGSRTGSQPVPPYVIREPVEPVTEPVGRIWRFCSHEPGSAHAISRATTTRDTHTRGVARDH